MPPPLRPLLTLAALLALKVLLLTFSVPRLKIPPPHAIPPTRGRFMLLPLNVLLLTFSVPLL